MNILITGTSRGIGRATALLFLHRGHHVEGIDINPSTIEDKNYTHHILDVRFIESFPEIKNINVIVNNAGIQEGDVIGVNLKGTINITEKYGIQPEIKSIVNVGSASAHTGSEFPEYCASKSGILAYTKNVAQRIAPYGATCNSVDAGGVITELNKPVLTDETLWNRIMELTPLKRWATPEEIAEWIYFLSVAQSFCTGQSILIDGGEAINTHFIWPNIKE